LYNLLPLHFGCRRKISNSHMMMMLNAACGSSPLVGQHALKTMVVLARRSRQSRPHQDNESDQQFQSCTTTTTSSEHIRDGSGISKQDSHGDNRVSSTNGCFDTTRPLGTPVACTQEGASTPVAGTPAGSTPIQLGTLPTYGALSHSTCGAMPSSILACPRWHSCCLHSRC
jgi:hypothetical protein